jgi:hypothetical protein
VKDNYEDGAQIRVSLETLARHILETPRNELAALRAAVDRQISSLEARLEPGAQQPAVDATAQILAEAVGEHVKRAKQRAGTDLAQALAVNDMLRKALDNAQQQLESAHTDLSAADAHRKAIAAQHREAVNEKKKIEAQLKNAQQEAEELAVERLELQRTLKEVTAAKALAETRYQQLVAASQKLTDGLSRTLHDQRGQVPPSAAAPQKRSVPADNNAASSAGSSSRSTPPPIQPAATPLSSRKRPLQFSGPARDAKRVKIRRGTQVSVDGIPGELVDLSAGGAQAVLRQMVKPNQLVRMVLPTAASQLICKGRIVWVVYEQPGTSLSAYRMGVKFTDIDAGAVEDFMRDFCEEWRVQSQHSSEIA